jgi:meiotic recombination protein REC8
MDTDIYQIPGHVLDLDLPVFGSDLPDGEAFPIAAQYHGSNQAEFVQSSSTASAPMRKKRRKVRVLPTDSKTELRNKDLADWNANYLQNMDTVVKGKKQARIAQQAKKDAEYFVWGSGIGGFAHQYANITGPNPFELFIGDNLFQLATGFSRKKVAGRKHDRDSGIDDETQNESRRVRQKTGECEEELGRGFGNEDFSIPLGGDEVELPRDAVTALDDQQIFSSMPWNISASKHGSSAIPRSGRLSSLDRGRPGSRLVSASPLHGRGQPLGLEALNLESEADIVVGGDEDIMPEPSSPPTVVGALPRLSIRVAEAISAEGENFLDFVTEAIIEKRKRTQKNFGPVVGAEGAANVNEITFHELLPPAENNKMIACQGLMMLLTLSTKGLLDVQQSEHFHEIGLKLTDKAKARQVIEISDGDESDEEEEEEDESGDDIENMDQEHEEAPEPLQEEGLHFEEQFAAGHTAHEDDNDSLYDP